MQIRPVILSGGSGSRLWPKSRKSLPKQFIDFPVIGSLFEQTLTRANAINDSTDPLIVSNKEHGFHCRKIAKKLNLYPTYLLEEVGRNTAPAVCLAALSSNPSDILLIMPSDHWIDDTSAFVEMVGKAALVAKDGRWVTFGVKPNFPSTGYGYIQTFGDTYPKSVKQFVEKPDEKMAREFLLAGSYFWNSGIFMVRADACLRSFAKHQPDLTIAARDCWNSAYLKIDERTFAKPKLENVESISIDYAILEKLEDAAFFEFGGNWSDLGNWESLSTVLRDNGVDSNPEEAILVDAQNTFIQSAGRTVAAVGVKDLIIVEEDDATLVLGNGASEGVKEAVELLKLQKNKAATEHTFEYRPWGMFENLLDCESCKVKRLTVDPGQTLSLQYHKKRSEHWLVVSGKAHVHLENNEFSLEPGQSLDIPLGANHALGNKTNEPVVLIEVQMGSYFGEDDIVRVNDPYDR